MINDLSRSTCINEGFMKMIIVFSIFLLVMASPIAALEKLSPLMKLEK